MSPLTTDVLYIYMLDNDSDGVTEFVPKTNWSDFSTNTDQYGSFQDSCRRRRVAVDCTPVTLGVFCDFLSFLQLC